VIWLVAATASPRISRNATSRIATGTPLARATSRSSVENNSGRAPKASTASVATATISSVSTWPVVTPRNVPNRSVSVPPSTDLLSDRNRNPAARPVAWTVAVTAFSFA
jgi:hypothetical protein